MKKFYVKGTHLTIGMHMVGLYTAVSAAVAKSLFIADFGSDFFIIVKEIC